jgi:hypothetical protein
MDTFVEGRQHDVVREWQRTTVRSAVDPALLRTDAERASRTYTAKVGRRAWVTVILWSLNEDFLDAEASAALTVVSQHTPSVALEDYFLLDPRLIRRGYKKRYLDAFERFVTVNAAGHVMRRRAATKQYQKTVADALPRVTSIVWSRLLTQCAGCGDDLSSLTSDWDQHECYSGFLSAWRGHNDDSLTPAGLALSGVELTQLPFRDPSFSFAVEDTANTESRAPRASPAASSSAASPARPSRKRRRGRRVSSSESSAEAAAESTAESGTESGTESDDEADSMGKDDGELSDNSILAAVNMSPDSRGAALLAIAEKKKAQPDMDFFTVNQEPLWGPGSSSRTCTPRQIK